jgi:Zn-finger nucleic acid-binding protein
VRYLKCPLCDELMNRVNFGRRSGVIVDVCTAHGTWFDAGELTRAIAFVARGGLEESRRRESEEKRELARTAARLEAELASTGAGRGAPARWNGREAASWGEHRFTLFDILSELFR